MAPSENVELPKLAEMLKKVGPARVKIDRFFRTCVAWSAIQRNLVYSRVDFRGTPKIYFHVGSRTDYVFFSVRGLVIYYTEYTGKRCMHDC